MLPASNQNVVIPATEGLHFCHSRREYDASAGIFFCAHPQVHIARHLVDSQVCRQCEWWQRPAPEEFLPYFPGFEPHQNGRCWFLGEQVGLRACPSCKGNVQIKVFDCRHADHEVTTLDECNLCPDYEPQLKRHAIQRWSVAVTTAPRKVPTLARTLDSLARAGWDNPLIFAEPGTVIPRAVSQGTMVQRPVTLGEWCNWYLGLSELYQRDPWADAYLMVQDDVLFCQNLREYLEAVLWPAETAAVASLYNPLAGPTCDCGFEKVSAGIGMPGALALLFPNAAVRMLLGDRKVLLHRRRGPTAGRRLTDVVVGQWAERSGFPAYLHVPSLCQHIGDTTTVWEAEQDRVIRTAPSFVGETFDARSLNTGGPPPCPTGAVRRIPTRRELLACLPQQKIGAELGVYDGLFSEEILAVAKPRLLFLVDTWKGITRLKRPDSAGNWVPYDLEGEAALTLVQSRLSVPIREGQVQLTQMEATAWLSAQPPASLDWVYLDDDHSYEHVRQELELARKCVRPGGWILGHDYCEVLPGVPRAVNEFCAGHGLSIEILTDEEPRPVYPRLSGMPANCRYNSFAIHLPEVSPTSPSVRNSLGDL
jgi:hypothetical protein